MIQAIVFLPLLAALVAGLGGRVIGNFAAKSITTGALIVSCLLSWPIFLWFVGGSAEAQVVPVLDWIHSGTMSVDWALRVDALTAVMLVVVTSVSSLVHVYSWGYMEEDPSQPRFALFWLGEYANVILMCALNAILFWGGFLPPLNVDLIPWFDIPGIFWLTLKMSIFFFIFGWVKATVPRYRYDQLMRLGWKIFLPLSLVFVVLISGWLMLTRYGVQP